MMARLRLAFTQIVATISLVLLLSALNLSWSGGVEGTEAVEPKTDAANGGRRRVLDDADWLDTWRDLTSTSAVLNSETIPRQLEQLRRTFDRFVVLPPDQDVKDKINRIIDLGKMGPESCTKSKIEDIEKWSSTTGPVQEYSDILKKKFFSLCADSLLDEAEQNVKNIKGDLRTLYDRLIAALKKYTWGASNDQYHAELRTLMLKLLFNELDKTYDEPDQTVSPGELFDEYILKACKDFASAYEKFKSVQQYLLKHASPEKDSQYQKSVKVESMCGHIEYNVKYKALKASISKDFTEAKKLLDEYIKNPPVLDDSPNEEAEEVEAEPESDESSPEPAPKRSPPRKRGLHEILDSIANFNTRPYLEKIKETFHQAPQTAQENRPSDVEESDTPAS